MANDRCYFWAGFVTCGHGFMDYGTTDYCVRGPLLPTQGVKEKKNTRYEITKFEIDSDFIAVKGL